MCGPNEKYEPPITKEERINKIKTHFKKIDKDNEDFFRRIFD